MFLFIVTGEFLLVQSTTIYLGNLLNLDVVKDSQFYFSCFLGSPIQLHGSERPTYITSTTSEYMCFLRYTLVSSLFYFICFLKNIYITSTMQYYTEKREYKRRGRRGYLPT